MSALSQNPPASNVVAFFCTGRNLWAGVIWQKLALGRGKRREEVPGLNCRNLECCIREPSLPQCPLPQLMTKDTDSLSPENYGNFDTQVMMTKLAKGCHPTLVLWAAKMERLVRM